MYFLMLERMAGIVLVVVIQIGADSHHVQVLILLDPEWLFNELSASEVRRLVHIQPNT